jgi:uncharacterized membrane protein (DUF106 family)
MDVTYEAVLLTIIGILMSAFLGIIIGYLHTINEKLSEVKTTLAEIKEKLSYHK